MDVLNYYDAEVFYLKGQYCDNVVVSVQHCDIPIEHLFI
jgi:hypothetical protein